MIQRLSGEQLHRPCTPEMLVNTSAEDVSTLETIIGQERAVRSLRFGLGIKSKGFNIYVAGFPGTGKATAVKQFLEEMAQHQPVPPDWCYVHDFEGNDRPNAIQLPAGKASQFKSDLESLLQSVAQEIRAVFESDEYLAQQEEIIKSFDQKKQRIFESLNEQASQHGFLLQASPMGLLTIPVYQGKPLSEADFMALGPEVKEEISKKQQEMQEILETSIRMGKSEDKKARDAIDDLEQQVVAYTISPHFVEMSERYRDIPEVGEFLENVRNDIIQNRSRFKSEQNEPTELPVNLPEPTPVFLKRYQVNVLVDHSRSRGAPVVLETNPTYSNLCGRIEQEARFGALTTDHTLIRKGCLHQANGGYLVLPVVDLLRNPLAWETLKRALENREITIEDAGEKLGVIFTKSLRPEPIPLDVKVILIGPPEIYLLLLDYDEKFNELFKVKADFDSQIDWDENSLIDYGTFAHKVCLSENLKPLDNSGVARLIEYGARLAGHQQKLTTRFGEVADVIREASYYAVQEKDSYVTGEHVRHAIEERVYRSSLIQDHILELIQQGTIRITVTGEQVGQVNGLSVREIGSIAFGQPNRISASISLGREGIIDIEREAKLSGPIHTKGVLILSGYLAEKFAQTKPLSLSARLVFEQSYSGVEGDSASSTEVYALLSAIAEIPIRQGIAVTGSVNQKGEIQAIGGVNEKIEGFFEVCQILGLDGKQGVIIPASNRQNLMLKESVIAAVQSDKFHIWTVETIEDGIEILTGMQAGQRSPDGTFEQESVFAKVEARLTIMAECLAKFGNPRN